MANSEISLDYGDVLKAYQTKSGELLNQLISAEARLNASANLITELKKKITELTEENEKLQKSSSKPKKPQASNDNVIDYN